jgi:hypothetical protein
MSSHKERNPRSSKTYNDNVTPRFLNPSHHERLWIGRIPDSYPDILRAPAVSYRAERDDPRIKANQYVSFVRPYKGKQGLLLIGRDQRPILIDETVTDKPLVLPMRLDREALLGNWIFSVSLYEAEGLIQLEDCIVADGQQLRSSKPFKERFAKLQRFAESIWYQDKQFQLNWDIRVADIYALEAIRSAASTLNGGYLCLMPDLAQFRLLRVIPNATTLAKPVTVDGPQEFTCLTVDDKPDVYDLKDSKGLIIGRASIQTLSVSQRLQHLVSIGQPLKVMAEWNADFESYVVTSVI